MPIPIYTRTWKVCPHCKEKKWVIDQLLMCVHCWDKFVELVHDSNVHRAVEVVIDATIEEGKTNG